MGVFYGAVIPSGLGRHLLVTRFLIPALGVLGLGSAAAAADAPRALNAHEKTVIRSAVLKSLKDPDSAKFRWNPKVLDSTIYCGFVNSKNSFGGYVGFEPFMVFRNPDGSIILVQIAGQEPDDPVGTVLADTCRQPGYLIDATGAGLIEG